MTRIIAWSGGPDSTYELVRALVDTDDPVVAACVHSSKETRRQIMAAKRAQRRLYQYLYDSIRPFEHVVYEAVSGWGMRTKDSELHFMLPMIAHVYDDPHVYWCYCSDDVERHREPILDVLSNRLVPCHDVNLDVPKSRIRDVLEPLIWPMTTSCQFPRNDLSACGKCRKCNERAAA